MANLPIYLDNNATTPCDPRVLEAMLPWFSQSFGNAASRNHVYGWAAEEGVDIAREQVASLIGAEPKEIIFTSGATEGDNLALKGVFETYSGKGNHIITCNIEHNAVLDSCRHIEKLGGEITYLPVLPDGMIDLAELESAIRPETILISIMRANNETGTLLPLDEICAIGKKNNVLLFTDATQAAGKIPLDVNQMGIDIMAFSAHKMYGPKGIGALYVRRKNPRVKLTAQIDGGGHERGMRSGTLNVPAIVGFGKACMICAEEMEAESNRLSRLRDRLETSLLKVAGSFVNGDTARRLPGTTNICFGDLEGEGLLMGINRQVAVSSGSACTSASTEPSHVLKALGLTDEQAHSSIRFGLGRFTKDSDIDIAIDHVLETIRRISSGREFKASH